MSFYGNQYLELQKFFYRFLLSKSSASIEPNSNYGTLEIDSDNWIKVEAESDHDKIIFSHENANLTGDNLNIDSVKFIAQNEITDEVTQLEHEDYLQVNQFQFDEKGHIQGVKNIYYQMPEKLYWKNLSELPAATTAEG